MWVVWFYMHIGSEYISRLPNCEKSAWLLKKGRILSHRAELEVKDSFIARRPPEQAALVIVLK